MGRLHRTDYTAIRVKLNLLITNKLIPQINAVLCCSTLTPFIDGIHLHPG